MRARWKALALTAVLGLMGTDCLGPVVPIPPPGVERFASTLCPAQLCNGGGVLLRVRGTGRLGSLVVVENLTTRLPGEGRYASSGYANADPVTGQAAWFDLRVRIERADATALEPSFAPLPRGEAPPDTLAYGTGLREKAKA